MDVSQAVFHTEPVERRPLWAEPFVIPVYVALCLIIIQILLAFSPFDAVRVPFGLTDPLPESTPRSNAPQSQGFFEEAKTHIKSLGTTTVLMNLLRLCGTLALAGLTFAAPFILEGPEDTTVANTLSKWGDPHKGGKHRGLSGAAFTRYEWIEVIHLVLYSYTSFLALVTLVSRRRWRSAAGVHLTLIMLSVLGVYAYRDVYPLATFTLVPKDAAQGWLLWSRVCIVTFVGVLIPLISPRTYRPVDPLNPSKEVNLEQTASWLSFITFSFFDPIIWKAARSSHLDYESLPPLADYDAAAHLVSNSENILDPFIRRKRTHLFWGLMKIFGWEYTQLFVAITLRVFFGFMSPYGLNRLLVYLATKGEGATVRPWVWILWLFLGPVIGSFTLQYYSFLSTRTLVRTEGILTQLVFDHALRIRMTVDTESKSAPPSVSNTPDTQSIIDSRNTDDDDETLEGNDRASPASPAKFVTKRKNIPSPAQASLPAAKLQSEAKTANLIGKINNLVSTDLGNITNGRDFLFLVWYGPLQAAICIWFLYAILGWSALVGMVVMVVTAPLPSYIAKLINGIQSERMKKTDARVQSVIEILSVIRMTKLFGWEHRVDNIIAEKRDVELRWLKKRQFWNLGNMLLNFFIPLLTMLVTFAVYTTAQGRELTAAIVFSSMAVFDMMREVLQGTFFIMPAIINAKISLGRINEFLLDTELLDRFTTEDADSRPTVDPSQNIDPDVIGFRNATFLWGSIPLESDDAPLRRRFRLVVEGELFFHQQKLNLVIGPTASGKTSLLMALLGEMHYEPDGEDAGFNLPRNGGVAYAAQETWVRSESIRANILFGKPYERERYKKVIYQCCLERDLDLFEAGDTTEVGEKGLTLSGGQKARITLARAVYSDANVVLLDDILAALDVHTAKFIVDNCLKGDLLQGRTIILVTHNVAMVAPICDFVVSMGPDGRIASQGTVSDTLTKDPTLRQEVEEMNRAIQKAEGSEDDVEGRSKDNEASGKLVVAEEIALGHVGWSALMLYFSSMGGIIFWFGLLGGLLLAEVALSLATWFLGYWASQYNEHPGMSVSVSHYLTSYSLILGAVMVLEAGGLGLLVIGSVKASRTIHRKLIQSILGTTFRWLDAVPTARIVARCTQDITAVDGPVSEFFGNLTNLTYAMVVKFLAVVLFVPVFIFPAIGVFVVGVLCGQLYMKAQLSVKREMSNRRSPVLSNFGAAVSGLTSIRAYGAQAMCREESLKRIDGYTRPARTYWNCNRWVSFRCSVIGDAFAAGLASYLVYGHSALTASNIGFSLTMAVAFSNAILWWIRVLNEFEIQGNSLERIESYVNIEQEPKAIETYKPPAYWPASGAVVVERLCARYSADSPQVLHDLSFEIKSGERVGIVGRTGSGKSSLTLSLLRCIPTEGRVTLDGLLTDTINLDALRSSITIIPQQPELLSGTLRENLDPFSEHSDAVLNDALRAAGLFNIQDEDDAAGVTLDSNVSSGGGNLSVGQRQILALARAVVRQSKLLILDEATSAIDYATDSVIQNTLRDVLKEATLIIVAHRLQTIMDADKIMVLDAGKLVEFDSPANLLKKSDGYFYSLVNESSDRDALWEMVQISENVRLDAGLRL